MLEDNKSNLPGVYLHPLYIYHFRPPIFLTIEISTRGVDKEISEEISFVRHTLVKSCVNGDIPAEKRRQRGVTPSFTELSTKRRSIILIV